MHTQWHLGRVRTRQGLNTVRCASWALNVITNVTPVCVGYNGVRGLYYPVNKDFGQCRDVYGTGDAGHTICTMAGTHVTYMSQHIIEAGRVLTGGGDSLMVIEWISFQILFLTDSSIVAQHRSAPRSMPPRPQYLVRSCCRGSKVMPKRDHTLR